MNEVSEGGIDMRSNRLRYHKNRAKLFYKKAETSLNQKMITNGFNLKFETASLYFYQASISYRSCSKWREAGDSLCRCAQLNYSRLKYYSEAAALYTEASEAYSKVDNNDTIRCLNLAITIYCDIGSFPIAGRLQKKVADLHRNMRHFEEAAESYRKAADFLSSLPGQSDLCLEKSAECFIECDEYQIASDLYVLLAESCTQSNLKFFQTKIHLFRAILCQIAIPISNNESSITENFEMKYGNIRTNIKEYELIDVTWRCSKHCKFLLDIINIREDFNQHEFADHIYYFNTVYRLNNYEIQMLRIINDEIVSELERQILERKKEQYEATKKQRRKAKLLKKRRQLRERGLNPFSIRLEDIDDSDEEEENEKQKKNDNKKGRKKSNRRKSEMNKSENDDNNNNDNNDNGSLNSEDSNDSDDSDGSSSGSSSSSESSESNVSDIELPDELKEKQEPVRKNRATSKASNR